MKIPTNINRPTAPIIIFCISLVMSWVSNLLRRLIIPTTTSQGIFLIVFALFEIISSILLPLLGIFIVVKLIPKKENYALLIIGLIANSLRLIGAIILMILIFSGFKP